MTKTDLRTASIEELVRRFEQIALAQDDAILRNQTSKYNRLYDEMDSVDRQLRDHGTDARRALLRLYDHPNEQVRLKAAIRTLAVAPQEARKVLDEIRAAKVQPYALDAGFIIRGLDDGSFNPT
jgi:hypothetical protein